jgi:predicted Abi (CAAX) family protease
MLKRLISSLATWPSPKGWANCVSVAAPAVLAIVAMAWGGGFLHWQPDVAKALRLPLILLIPAFSEEVLFRGPIPRQGETQHPLLWLAATTAIFTLWHVVEALSFLPGARLFLQPAFLACAATLGLACGIMRYRTGSLWPAVALHGLMVWLWQSLFSGPGVSELLRS